MGKGWVALLHRPGAKGAKNAKVYWGEANMRYGQRGLWGIFTKGLLTTLLAGARVAMVCADTGTLAAAGERFAFPVRECYCPAHFGNAYEAMGPREMAAYQAEMKGMGFNRYGDWITTTDICNPYTSVAAWDLGKEQLDRKKKAFRAAQASGLGLNLIVTPNHVYLDQLKPEILAKRSQRAFGQIICPSRPEGRKIILENFERWFKDFADEGIRLDAFTAFAYDYGGCECDACKPWIVTFAKLMKEVHAGAEKHHPGIEPWFCSWWWTPVEHAAFNAWAEKEAPGWVKAMTMHIEYGKTRPKDVPVPAGCRRLAFVHVGYGDQRDNEVYGHNGAVIAPRRLPETLRELRGMGFDGFQAYSEGVFDDCNKMLLAGIGSGAYATADEALRAYAKRYFGVSEKQAEKWSAWLAQWGVRQAVPLPEASEELARLSERKPAVWRLEHWRSKTELETLERAIGTPKPHEWTPEKRAAAERYFAAQERMYREVYRLGPLRHVLNPRVMPPAWLASWNEANKRAASVAPDQPQQ